MNHLNNNIDKPKQKIVTPIHFDELERMLNQTPQDYFR